MLFLLSLKYLCFDIIDEKLACENIMSKDLVIFFLIDLDLRTSDFEMFQCFYCVWLKSFKYF